MWYRRFPPRHPEERARFLFLPFSAVRITQARDLKGRTILFHAVKSENDEVFDAVRNLVEENDNLQPGTRKSWLVEEGQLDETQQKEHNPPRFATIAGKRICVDAMGKNLLHRVCDSGSLALLTKVIKEAEAQGDAFLRELLRKEDKRGWTPWMHVLRHDFDCSSENCDIVHKKLDELSGKLLHEDVIEMFTKPAPGDHHYTALMHAAHGGPKQLAMTRAKILELSTIGQRVNNSAIGPDDGTPLKLDFALGIPESSSAEPSTGQPSEADIRRALLLSEAASGGYICVLEDIVSAIKVTAMTFFQS